MPDYSHTLASRLRHSFEKWAESLREGQLQLSRLTLFSLLFAWANLLHAVTYSEWIYERQLLGWCIFLVNLALALRPSSIPLFLAALALRLVYTAFWMPMLRGHLFLEGLFCVGIVICMVNELRKLGKVSSFSVGEQERLFESFGPYLRITCLLVYGAATLAKLNTAFVDPQKSVAVQLLLWTAEFHAWFPTGPWAEQLSIWGTLLFEGGIPILLFFRRTRWLGLVCGLVFHTLLAMLPLRIATFSLTMCLLLAAWLPSNSPQRIVHTFHRLVRFTRLTPPSFLVLIGLLTGITGYLYATDGRFILKFPKPFEVGLGIWWVQTILMFAALASIRNVRVDPDSSALKIRSRIVKLYLAFIFLNYLSPYIGLKTRNALTMHSNLRTEKGYWNHLIFPESMRVFTFQDELVEIVESNLSDFDHLQKQGMRLPFFEFRRWCRSARFDFFVVYKDPDGLTKRFDKRNGEGSDPELMKRSWMLEWILGFNPTGSTHDYLPGLVKHVGPSRNVPPSFETPTD